jgi:DNA repair protein RadC
LTGRPFGVPTLFISSGHAASGVEDTSFPGSVFEESEGRTPKTLPLTGKLFLDKTEDYEMTNDNLEQRWQAEQRPESEKKNITYLREISVKYSGPRRKLVGIRQSSDVKKFLDGILKNDAREHFFTLYLDGAHEVVGYATTSIGTANTAPVHPREVFQPAILAGAVSIIVSHNHPSGNSSPSSEDRVVTKMLREAGEILGIKLLDHVILGAETYYSFAEMGEL